jgi:hypothetical protein
VRTLTCSLIALLALSCVNLAQDVPQPAKKVDTATLLKQYLKAEGEAKHDLRAKLLALSADELRAAIAGAGFEAEPKAGEINKWFTNCPDGFRRPYWVYVPETYDPAKRYPLLVCMHGGVSGWPLDKTEDTPAAGEYSIRYWLPNLSEEQKKEVVILGCSAGVPETSKDAMWWRLKGQQNVLRMIRETRRRVSIDDDRVIATGHSDGGSGTFGFAFLMPDSFAGFYAMNGCPVVPPSDGVPVWLENLKGENFYCFNGGRDGLYPAKRMTPIYDQANKLGAGVKYKVYPKLSHQVADVLEDEVAGFTGKQLKEWRRNLLPNEIDWACDNPARGRRAWLSIDKIADLGAANTAPENAEIVIPAGRPTLGVRLQQNVKAPTVENVVKGSAADKMGIQKGDVIKKLDDHEIKDMQDLINALDTKAAGEKVAIVVDRAGEEKTLKGSFPKAKQREKQKQGALVARVIAKLEKPGRVSLSVRNASKVTIYVAPSMLDAEGKLHVSIKAPKGSIGIAVTKKVGIDKGLMLEQFEKTGDRKLPWTGKLQLDVKKLLGPAAKPADPDQKEDEF